MTSERGIATDEARLLAEEALAALDARRQVASFSARRTDLDLAGAYEVAALVKEMRVARGERTVGRKIGFTNERIWDEYNVHAPIWGWMYDSTVREAGSNAQVDLAPFLEPRIEPEIALGLRSPPEPGMGEEDLLACIGWVAHGIEIVQSLFPAWRFSAADTVIGFGLHGAYLLGPRHPVLAEDRGRWTAFLNDLEVELLRDRTLVDRGRGSNALGGPLSALRHLVKVLADSGERLEAGEIITTGTLTRAFPVAPGETWQTRISDTPLEGLNVTFA